MGWPAWLLIALLSVAALVVLAAHLLRFTYAFDYIFPDHFQGRLIVSFPGWRRVIPFGELLDEAEEDLPEDDRVGTGYAPATAAAAPLGDGPGPRPGQEGFLAVPWSERRTRFRKRLKAAALKWALDLPVWRLLAQFTLRTGFSTLRLVGPSMERLHVGAADVGALGRLAAWWSAAAGMFPFLACPVEWGFDQRPFTLRMRISGGCTALGVLAFALAWVFSIPWRGFFRRFVHCWRDPRLNRIQRRLLRVAA